jgi:hypothetical protein
MYIFGSLGLYLTKQILQKVGLIVAGLLVKDVIYNKGYNVKKNTDEKSPKYYNK